MMKTVNGYKDGTTIVNSCKDGPGWGHSARCARNVLLLRSRRMTKTVNGYKDGTTVVNSCKDGAIRQGVQ